MMYFDWCLAARTISDYGIRNARAGLIEIWKDNNAIIYLDYVPYIDKRINGISLVSEEYTPVLYDCIAKIYYACYTRNKYKYKGFWPEEALDILKGKRKYE